MNRVRIIRLILGLTLVSLLAITHHIAQANPQGGGRINCVGGYADIYPCAGIDLVAHMPLSAIGAEDSSVMANDHWGWTDPVTDRNYVMFGLTNGTSFIDITDLENPVYLGKLPSYNGGESVYRDIKVYENIAYIVADNLPTHGMQMFDLTQLRDVVSPPVTFTETAHYDEIGSGHTIWINSETASLYVVLRTMDGHCSAGVQMLDLADPLAPTLAGCLDHGEAPISTVECLNYDGPDADYSGRELCFMASDDNVSVADVTDKSNTSIISRFTYPGIMRAHQGAMTEDLRFWLMADMHDEMHHGTNIRTYIFNIEDLDNPVVLGHYELPSAAMDHSMFIRDNYVYQANLRAGMQIFDLTPLPNTNLIPVGTFDTDPASDSPTMNGVWSVYPWWDDNIVTVSDTDAGFFITQFVFSPTDVALSSLDGNVMQMNWYMYLLPLLSIVAIGYVAWQQRRPTESF